MGNDPAQLARPVRADNASKKPDESITFYHFTSFSEGAFQFAIAGSIFLPSGKQIGGSVCESNAPTTSGMPSAGFEDHQVGSDRF